jgi:hypothetical protein
MLKKYIFHCTHSSVCPEITRFLKHEHENKNFTHTIKKHLFKLNFFRSTVTKKPAAEGLLDCIETEYALGITASPYLLKLFIKL